jgi:hypothetical protein
MVSYQNRAQKSEAFERSAKIGKLLQTDHPEIADLYRKGHILREIAKQLDIASKYHLPEEEAIFAVSKALSGHIGNSSSDNYKGIMPPREKRALSRAHISIAARRTMNSINPKTGHKVSVERGRKTSRDRGFTLWILKREEIDNGSLCCIILEIEFAYLLSQLPEYQFGTRTNNELIADVLNERYHSGNKVRDRYSVRWGLTKYRCKNGLSKEARPKSKVL